MKKRRWKVLFPAVTVVAAVFVYLCLLPAPEPHYQGRSLTAWLVQADQNATKPSEAEIARSAIVRIGTNALPFLVRWTRYPTDSLRSRICALSEQARRNRLGRICIPQSFTRDPALERFSLAARGFLILGPLAAPAAPKLWRELRAAPDWFTANACVSDLACIGPAGIPYLCEIITNVPAGGWTNGPVTFNSDMSPRVVAIKLLSIQGTNAGWALPVFVQATRDEEVSVALHATLALGLTGRGRPAAVAALTNALLDFRPLVRAWAADALSRLGNEAEPGLPSLLKALNDEDATVRRWASNALSVIAPRTLVQEGPQQAH